MDKIKFFGGFEILKEKYILSNIELNNNKSVPIQETKIEPVQETTSTQIPKKRFKRIKKNN
jgi:hypothetical protein